MAFDAQATKTIRDPQTGKVVSGIPANASQEFIDKVLARGREIQKEQEGVGFKALGAVEKVGSAIDRFTGAPIRTAIGELQEGRPFKAITKGITQPLRPARTAPTGKQIAVKAGLSKEPSLPFGVSPAGVAGFGVDVLADPFTLFGAGIPKAVKAGAGTVLKTGVKGTGKAFDILSGTRTAETTLPVIKKGIQSAGDVLRSTFRPKQVSNFAELRDIAVKNNINPELLPEAVEFGAQSFVSRAGRSLAEGPTGQARLGKFDEGLTQVSQATDSKILQIGGGKLPSPQEAGDIIRDGFNRQVKGFFDNIDLTHANIIQSAPGLPIDGLELNKLLRKLAGAEKAITKRVKFATGPQQAQSQELLQQIQNIRNAGGSYENLNNVRQLIGERFFTKTGLADVPPDIKRMRSLYNDINEALIGTVQRGEGIAGPGNIAGELVRNNKIIQQFFNDKTFLGKVISNLDVPPEKVFNNLILGGDSKKINTLKGFLSDEELNQLKAAFLNSLAKRTDNNLIRFQGLASSLRNIPKNKIIANNLFNPGEIDEFAQLVKLGDSFGIPILSTSGTGASAGFRSLLSTTVGAPLQESFLQAVKGGARATPQQKQFLQIPALPPVRRTAVPREAARGARLQSVQAENERQRQEALKRQLTRRQ